LKIVFPFEILRVYGKTSLNPKRIKSRAQIIRKTDRLNVDFKTFPGNQEIAFESPAIIIKPEANVPSPNARAQKTPSNAVLEIIVISKSKAISGAQGNIPAAKPKINKLPNVNTLFTANLRPQQGNFLLNKTSPPRIIIIIPPDGFKNIIKAEPENCLSNVADKPASKPKTR